MGQDINVPTLAPGCISWRIWLYHPSAALCQITLTTRCYLLKAKFHYASWFEAGRRQVRSQSPLCYLVQIR